VNFDIMW